MAAAKIRKGLCHREPAANGLANKEFEISSGARPLSGRSEVGPLNPRIEHFRRCVVALQAGVSIEIPAKVQESDEPSRQGARPCLGFGPDPRAPGFVSGCGHTDPFTSPPYGSDSPFDPAPPVRLTFNPLADRGGAWVPDGSGILYSAQQIGRTDHDVCLALLSPTGGRQQALTCDLTVAGVDSTNAIESAAPAADGRLAFVEASSRIGATATLREGIAVAPTLDPRGATIVQPIPYAIPGEPAHTHVTALRWLSPGTLGFVGGNVAILADCLGCPTDTIVANLKVVTLDAAGGSAPAVVPGTDFASGLSPGSTDDEIYCHARRRQPSLPPHALDRCGGRGP